MLAHRFPAFFSQNTDGHTPLVLLHGFCEDSSLWEVLMPFFAEMPLVRVDLLGFGGSPMPAAPADMGQQAEALAAVLAELRIEKCVLVGHSMGGYVALEFAEKHPECLAGLGLLHSHPYPDAPERRENRSRGIELLRAGKKDQYVAQLFPSLFPAPFAQAAPEVLERLIRRARAFSADGIIAALEAMMTRKNHEKTLENAPFPVLFIVGTEDSLIERAQAEAMTALPSVADVRVFEGVGHMAMFESPEKTAAALHGFYDFCLTQAPRAPR